MKQLRSACETMTTETVARLFGVPEDHIRLIRARDTTAITVGHVPRKQMLRERAVAVRGLQVLAGWEAGESMEGLHDRFSIRPGHIQQVLRDGVRARQRQYGYLVVRLPGDRAPYGQAPEPGPDSPTCGTCMFIHRLGRDAPWGICGNRRSPRRGLLTNQQQGGYLCGYQPAALPDPDTIELS